MPDFPRYFTRQYGFRDKTAYIRCDSETTGALVFTDGSERSARYYLLSQCLELVETDDGAPWKELTAAEAAALLEADDA